MGEALFKSPAGQRSSGTRGTPSSGSRLNFAAMKHLHQVNAPASARQRGTGWLAMVSRSAGNGSPCPRPGATLVDLPFDFFVGEIQFGAGPYTIEPAGRPEVFTVRRLAGGSPAVLVQGTHLPNHGHSAASRLLFCRQGKQYFLAQVLTDTTLVINP